jgi:hypothetical protein
MRNSAVDAFVWLLLRCPSLDHALFLFASVVDNAAEPIGREADQKSSSRSLPANPIGLGQDATGRKCSAKLRRADGNNSNLGGVARKDKVAEAP